MSLSRFLRPLKKLRPFLARRCARSPRLAGFFWLLSGDFRREHAGVLYGQMIHTGAIRGRDELEAEDGPRYTLRRNTHRLEKGLIMRPRRPVFAGDYIGETVDAYVALADRARCDTQADLDEGDRLLAAWSGDVLHRYFEAIDPASATKPGLAERLTNLEDAFASAHKSLNVEVGEHAPYRRDLGPLGISYDDMLALAKRRRSVRWYEQRPVDRSIVDRAIRVAAYSPSACNRQPFEFRVFDEPEAVHRIGSIAMGTKGFSDNFPGLVVLVGKLRAYFDARDRHVIYIDASLAAMAFQFALEVQGVSSCCINWPDVRSREVEIGRVMDLEPDERVIMLISFGHPDPDGLVPFSQKKSLDELRRYNVAPGLAPQPQTEAVKPTREASTATGVPATPGAVAVASTSQTS
ncbi:MAG: nitroreductase family protein [Planctomycetota bacterium]